MAAIVLDHEETDEQARGRHHSHEADPAVKVKGHPHQGPNRSEGNGRDRKLEAATHGVRLAKAAEQLSQRAGFAGKALFDQSCPEALACRCLNGWPAGFHPCKAKPLLRATYGRRYCDMAAGIR